MPLKYSKRVTSGTVVTKRGDTYIRCGRRARFVGVFQSASQVHMITEEGEVIIALPQGIVTYGPTIVAFTPPIPQAKQAR